MSNPWCARRLLMAPIVLAAACAGPPAASPSRAASPATPAPVPRPALVVFSTDLPSREPSRASWLRVYSMEADGRLVSVGPRQELAPVYDLVSAHFDERRHLLHVIDRGHPAPLSIATYQVESTTGVATLLGTTRLPRAWHLATLHPSGRFLYGAARDVRQEIDGLELDPHNGAVLGPISGSPFGWETYAGVSGFDWSPSGRFLYAHGTRFYKTQVLLSFAVDPIGGALRVSSELGVYDRMSNLLVDPQERFAYLLQFGRPSSWRGFAIHPGNGSLLELPNSPWSGTYANQMRYAASGPWVLAEGGWNGAGIDVATLRENAEGVFERWGAAALPREAYAITALLQEGPVVLAASERTVTALRLDEATGALEAIQTVAAPEGERILRVGLAR